MRSSRLWWLIIACLWVLPIHAQPTPTPSPTPENPTRTLTIWLPDAIAAPDDEAALALFLSQAAAFTEENPNVEINVRSKEVGTAGGIMATLRTGYNIAPSAMPTLTLLRRQDVVTARRAGLIQPLGDDIPLALQDDLDTVLQLGQLGTELVALPYLLELEHTVYRPENGRSLTDWSYDALLERDDSFVFPAGQQNSLSDVFLLQYLAAGGTFNDEGSLTLNEDALRSTLEFYETANDAELINGFALNYRSAADYLEPFMQGEFDAATFTSTQYLRLHADEPRLRIAPLPTPTGETTSLLNGWMWVLVTTDPARQALALDYITWMMDVERQATFAQQTYHLPSRLSAIQRGLASDPDVDAYLQLLDNPVLPITESDGGALARAMQGALSSVLTRELNADDATQRVINQLPQE